MASAGSSYLKNSFIFLVTGNDRVMLVETRDTHGKLVWGPPGGGIESKDSGPFAAMKREFTEETGFVLPQLNNPGQSYDYIPYRARIYYNETDKKFKPFDPKDSERGEVKRLYYFKISDIISYDKVRKTFVINNPTHLGPLRGAFVTSLTEMLKDKNFRFFLFKYMTGGSYEYKYLKYKTKYNNLLLKLNKSL